MSGKRLAPEQVAQAAILREAGYTLAAIADRLRVSPRTLQRHFAAHKVKPGALKEALIAQARKDLLARATDSDALKQEVAMLLVDDLATVRLIRAKLTNVIEALDLDDHQSATESARALAAPSTTLKNTQDVLRRSLNVDRVNAELEEENLPELVIYQMSAEEMAEARRQASERKYEY